MKKKRKRNEYQLLFQTKYKGKDNMGNILIGYYRKDDYGKGPLSYHTVSCVDIVKVWRHNKPWTPE